VAGVGLVAWKIACLLLVDFNHATVTSSHKKIATRDGSVTMHRSSVHHTDLPPHPINIGTLNNGMFTVPLLQRLTCLVQEQLNQNSPQQLLASYRIAGKHLHAAIRGEAKHQDDCRTTHH
jgi:hypothetical protein